MTGDTEASSAPPTDGAVMPCPVPWHAVEVHIVGVDGAPLRDIAVELRRDSKAVLRHLSNRKGDVRFDGLAPGRYMLALYELDESAWDLLSSTPLPAGLETNNSAAPWHTPSPAQPVLAVTHTVAPGDSTISLSEQYGHLADRIWNDEANSALRRLRREMNGLAPGDALAIPGRRPKSIGVDSGSRCVIERHGIPAVFRLRVLVGAQPIGSCPYLLTVDDTLALEGQTDEDGVLSTHLPARSKSGVLRIKSGTYWKDMTLRLSFGTVGAVEDDAGIASRLANLGMLPTVPWPPAPDSLAQAIRMLQATHDLPVTGVPDKATIDCLYEQHDRARS